MVVENPSVYIIFLPHCTSVENSQDIPARTDALIVTFTVTGISTHPGRLMDLDSHSNIFHRYRSLGFICISNIQQDYTTL